MSERAVGARFLAQGFALGLRIFSSSKWIKTRGPKFARFEWQRGYAIFSVGLNDKDALVRYIDTQATHHQRRDFQAELRAMLVHYGVQFDERYVWD